MQTKRSWDAAFGVMDGYCYVLVKCVVELLGRRKVVVERRIFRSVD